MLDERQQTHDAAIPDDHTLRKHWWIKRAYVFFHVDPSWRTERLIPTPLRERFWEIFMVGRGIRLPSQRRAHLYRCFVDLRDYLDRNVYIGDVETDHEAALQEDWDRAWEAAENEELRRQRLERERQKEEEAEKEREGERRVLFAGRRNPRNVLRGCWLQMELPIEDAKDFFPYGSGPEPVSCDGPDLPESADVCLMENRREVATLHPMEIVWADWHPLYMGWAAGDDHGLLTCDSMTFYSETGELLRMKHLVEARRKGYEDRRLRRLCAQERFGYGTDEDWDEDLDENRDESWF